MKIYNEKQLLKISLYVDSKYYEFILIGNSSRIKSLTKT